MEALDDCVRAGKVRYIGASSMTARQFAKAQYTADLGGWTRLSSQCGLTTTSSTGRKSRKWSPNVSTRELGSCPGALLARGVLARPHTERGSTARRATDQSITRAIKARGPDRSSKRSVR
jgi:aryl-alcohol dehydrogenase-like predicted oxidoreductase